MDCFHDFCLACDKQCVDGPYCSQSCRLADLEKGTKSAPPSPINATQHWPAFDIKEPTTFKRTQTEPQQRLTPSSSRTSFTSTTSSNGMTEQARAELQEYYSHFDHTRAAKRRSSTR